MNKWRCGPLQIIEPLIKKTWGRDCVIFGYFWWAGKYFEWIIKQLLNSAFVGYEEFCRSRRMLFTSASVDNTLLDLQNSSYSTQPHSLIAKYLQLIYRLCHFDYNFVFVHCLCFYLEKSWESVSQQKGTLCSIMKIFLCRYYIFAIFHFKIFFNLDGFRSKFKLLAKIIY